MMHFTLCFTSGLLLLRIWIPTFRNLVVVTSMSLSKSLIKCLRTSGRSNGLRSFLILLVSDLKCNSGMSHLRIQRSRHRGARAESGWPPVKDGATLGGYLPLGEMRRVLVSPFQLIQIWFFGLCRPVVSITLKEPSKAGNGFPLAVNQACTCTNACSMVLVASYPGSWETWIKSHLFSGGLGQVSHLSPVNVFPPL